MEDHEIVELFWARSEKAIEETHKKYGRLFKYIAMNILSNNEDADECVNDTYYKAWDIIPPQKPVLLSAFLCRITRNFALKKYEYSTAQKRNPEATISFEELDECVSGIYSIEIETSPIEETINDFLETLNYENRNVFLRRYWFYDSISEISQRFKMSESKVTSMLFRTRNKLKKYLEKDGITI